MQQPRPARARFDRPSGAGKSNNARRLYAGWLDVERSMFEQFDSYTTENLVTFAGGWVEVRQFAWSRPLETVWATAKRCYFFNMTLAGRNPVNSAVNLSHGRRNTVETIGRLTMIPPGQTMSSSSLEGTSRSLRCMLDASLIDAYLPEPAEWDCHADRLHELLHLGGGQMEWLLRRMYREVQEPDFATTDVLESLARQLAVEVVRKFRLRGEDAGAGEPGHRVGGIAPWRMRLIRERVASSAPPPDLEELAALCGMTTRHLSRAFRTETGQSLGKYVEAAMVERANAMLGAGSPVKQVAATLGYSTSGSFAAAFRRATGLLPSEIKAIGARASEERAAAGYC